MTGQASTFLKLEDVVLPPPLPAIIAALIVVGLAAAGWHLAARLRKARPEPLDVAAGAIVSAAALAAAVHALAIAQLATVTVLRPIGWLVAAAGAVALARHGRAVAAAVGRGWSSLRAASPVERATLVLAAVATLGLAASAFGPPTDADSLRYHLGVPLDWLRHGGATPRPDWLTSRLVGLSESLNLLGLAAGTDTLGAALQLGGLAAAAIAVGALAQEPRDRRLAWLLVACCPAAAFLVPNQKPQMLPAAATAVAIVTAVQRFDRFGVEDAFLAFGCAVFAFASKTSFLLSAGFAIAVGLLAARESGRLRAAVAVLAGVVTVLWIPQLARSLAFFGDPLSPFLERFRPNPDPAVVAFATYLRNAGGARSAANLVRLPIRILATTAPGRFTETLGLGALAFVGALPALRSMGRPRILLWAALAASGTCLLLGQLSPRFFLEPYLWAGAAFAVAPWGRVKKVLVAALLLQGALAAAVALWGAATLFPGALTAGLRQKVLMRSAAGYAESRWLDAILPADAVVLVTAGRFQVFNPRPFAVAEPVLSPAPAAVLEQRAALLIRDLGVDTVVVDGPAKNPFKRLIERCGSPLGAATTFSVATRNPFNRASYEARAFTLHGCFAAPAKRP